MKKMVSYQNLVLNHSRRKTKNTIKDKMLWFSHLCITVRQNEMKVKTNRDRVCNVESSSMVNFFLYN